MQGDSDIRGDSSLFGLFLLCFTDCFLFCFYHPFLIKKWARSDETRRGIRLPRIFDFFPAYFEADDFCPFSTIVHTHVECQYSFAQRSVFKYGQTCLYTMHCKANQGKKPPQKTNEAHVKCTPTQFNTKKATCMS